MSNNSSALTGLLGLMAGAAVGAGLGILFAPDKGANTRKKIAEQAMNAKDTIAESAIDLKDRVASTVSIKKQNLEERLESLTTDASYKAEEVINKLENKLSELKAKNKKLQKS